ncbi:hypothetical protein D3C87_1631350 [compost metagenome]
MRSASFWAPTPRPGKFLGQVVTMRQVMLPWAMAGVASVVAAAAAPMVATEACLKNSRLFTGFPPDGLKALLFHPAPVMARHAWALTKQSAFVLSSMLLPAIAKSGPRASGPKKLRSPTD